MYKRDKKEEEDGIISFLYITELFFRHKNGLRVFEHVVPCALHLDLDPIQEKASFYYSRRF